MLDMEVPTPAKRTHRAVTMMKLGLAFVVAMIGAIVPAAPPAQAAAINPVLPTMTKTKLRSAKVPSMCSNPAGRLKRGRLVNGVGGYELRSSRTAIGTTKPGSKKGAAAAVICGYPWPGGRGTVTEYIVFWDKNGKVIGSFGLGKLGYAPDTRKVWIKGKTTYVQVRKYVRDNECMVCGTGEALLQFRWSKAKKRMVLVKTTRYTEADSAKTLAKAETAGKMTTARTYATPAVANRLKTLRGGKVQYVSCWANEFGGPRYCYVEYTKKGRYLGAQVEMKHVGWRHWKATTVVWTGTASNCY